MQIGLARRRAIIVVWAVAMIALAGLVCAAPALAATKPTLTSNRTCVRVHYPVTLTLTGVRLDEM